MVTNTDGTVLSIVTADGCALPFEDMGQELRMEKCCSRRKSITEIEDSHIYLHKVPGFAFTEVGRCNCNMLQVPDNKLVPDNYRYLHTSHAGAKSLRGNMLYCKTVGICTHMYTLNPG